MSSSRSSSPDTASSADHPLSVSIDFDANSPAYAPYIDDLSTKSFLRLRDFSTLSDRKFLAYQCFNYVGDGT